MRMGTANQGFIYRTRVAADAAGASVLGFHAARFRHSDEAAWRAAIDLGRVLVNGRRASPDQTLAAGDELEFHRPPWPEPDAPESFAVAFEDEHVLVVVKPAGLQVLPAGPFSAHPGALPPRIRPRFSEPGGAGGRSGCSGQPDIQLHQVLD